MVDYKSSNNSFRWFTTASVQRVMLVLQTSSWSLPITFDHRENCYYLIPSWAINPPLGVIEFQLNRSSVSPSRCFVALIVILLVNQIRIISYPVKTILFILHSCILQLLRIWEFLQTFLRQIAAKDSIAKGKISAAIPSPLQGMTPRIDTRPTMPYRTYFSYPRLSCPQYYIDCLLIASSWLSMCILFSRALFHFFLSDYAALGREAFIAAAAVVSETGE